jgi:nucleoside-diphosphate-sugar epimerase
VQNNRVALTGASGTLGRAIIKQFDDRKDVDLVALSRRKIATGRFTNCIVELDRREEIENALRDFVPNIFIHAAATGMQQPRPDEAILRKVNVDLPVRVAEMACELGCHFAFVSSGLAYKDQGRPLREDDPLGTAHPYGASKAEAEKQLRVLAQDRHLRLTIVRPFSFTGEGDFGSKLFPSLLRAAAEKKPFDMTSGEQVRDHAAVNDIARGVIAAALREDNERVRIFNLGSGETRSLRELVVDMVRALNLDVDLRFGARDLSPQEQMFMVADITRAKDELAWQPRETIAHAVWQLARASFSTLKLSEPR